RGSVTLVVVTCAGGMEMTMTSLKSAIAFSRAPLRLILYADLDNIKRLQDRIMQWPASVFNRITYDLRLVTFPKEDFERWKQLFRPCSTQRLFLPDILPNDDVVLYVDSDTLFLHPVEDLLEVFEEMNERHLMAVVHEIEEEATNWYHQHGKTPYIPPFGVNAGVMLINLTRMRNFGWVSRMVSLLDEYEDRLMLGDQDLVNILFSVHPDRLFRMTCRWNYRQATCTFHASCSGQTPALLHANRGRFMAPNWAPAFSAIHSVMRKYELGTSLERNFIDPLEHELHRVQRNECVVQFLLHSKQWRTMARQLDNERGFNGDATNATRSSLSST
ncbi:unnamed protein product, partial [Ixodes persulcatus]